MTSERARVTPEGGATEPLASALREDLAEARIQRMWQRIDHTPARRSGVLLALATAAVVVLALFGITRWLAPLGSGQLALASGDVPAVLAAEERAEAPHFEDGSQLTLQKGARVEVLRNDARSFVTALRRGDVTFDVKPGGPRHWIIEAGELSVEVVGTRFRVERHPEATRVSVEHGIVLVRGERVGGGIVRLTAGQSFSLAAPPAVVAPRAALAPRAAPSAPASASPPGSVSVPVTTSRAPVVAVETAVAVDPVAHHLAEADEARLRGDTAGAVRHFEAAWTHAPRGDARRGLAALSLARLMVAGNPGRTATILRSSLADMPSALREDAQARLVEAESRAGNAVGASQAAAEYRRLFPSGQRRSEVERWSEP